MNTDKLRIRVLFPLSLVLTALLATFVLVSYRMQKKQLEEEVLNRHNSVRVLFANQIKADFKRLRIGLELLAQDNRILSTWQKRDRDKLFEISRPIFEQLRKQSGIEYFNFTAPDRVNFLRVHRRADYGDLNDRFTQLQAEEMGDEFHGIELGSDGRFTLRAVRPIRLRNNLLGYLELGKAMDNMPREIRNIINVDLMILVDKRRPSLKEWDVAAKRNGQVGQWGQLRDFVITQSTIEEMPQGLTDLLNRYLLAHEAFAIRDLTTKDRNYCISFVPIMLANNQKGGDMVILDDITTAKAGLTESLRTFILISVGAWIGLFVLYSIILGRAQRQLAEYQVKVVNEVKSRTEAEQANIAKTEFLCNMSHEMRTPLNAIIGNTDLTLETDLTSDQGKYLRVVQRSSEALLRLISDLLDFSKIEAGQMDIEVIPFELKNLVDEVTEILSVRAHRKGLEFIAFVDPSLPNFFKGDPTRLSQVLVNLLSNAIKFTVQGEVVLRVEAADQACDGDKVGLHITVSDTGIGISDEDQKKIFEKFAQTDTSTTRKFGGAGLGLSIARSLTEMLGWGLSVESEIGKGSTFHLNLELDTTIAPGMRESQADLVSFSGSSVLIVDDNETSRLLLQRTLSAWGFNVQTASGGREALSRLQGSSTTIDLLLLDYAMPGMNGVQLARAIQADPKYRDIKTILLGANPAEARRIQPSKIMKTITKPVRQSALYGTIAEVFQGAGYDNQHQRAEAKAGETNQNRGDKRVLLVEDNPDNQNLAKNILTKAGYRVHVADHGKMAVEAVQKFPYDLILMDIQMPVMDGFEATKAIRTLERTTDRERVPIIALTAHAIENYREKCIRNDMDDYLTKPIRKKMLLAKVESWIEETSQVRVVGSSNGDHTAATSVASINNAMS